MGITQLLAIFGIANGINVMVWMIGLGLIGGIVNLVTSIMAWYAYDLAWQITDDSSSSSADITSATAVMAAIKDDMMLVHSRWSHHRAFSRLRLRGMVHVERVEGRGRGEDGGEKGRSQTFQRRPTTSHERAYGSGHRLRQLLSLREQCLLT